MKVFYQLTGYAYFGSIDVPSDHSPKSGNVVQRLRLICERDAQLCNGNAVLASLALLMPARLAIRHELERGDERCFGLVGDRESDTVDANTGPWHLLAFWLAGGSIFVSLLAALTLLSRANATGL